MKDELYDALCEFCDKNGIGREYMIIVLDIIYHLDDKEAAAQC